MTDIIIHIYVDADACPVKDEVMRVAERHALIATYVSNSWMRLPDSLYVNRSIALTEVNGSTTNYSLIERFTPAICAK